MSDTATRTTRTYSTRVERRIERDLDDLEYLAEYVVITRPDQGWSRFRPAIRH